MTIVTTITTTLPPSSRGAGTDASASEMVMADGEEEEEEEEKEDNVSDIDDDRRASLDARRRPARASRGANAGQARTGAGAGSETVVRAGSGAGAGAGAGSGGREPTSAAAVSSSSSSAAPSVPLAGTKRPHSPRQGWVFELYVRTAGGTIRIIASPDDTVGEFKKMVQRVEGIPPDDQRLIFAGKRRFRAKPDFATVRPLRLQVRVNAFSLRLSVRPHPSGGSLVHCNDDVSPPLFPPLPLFAMPRPSATRTLAAAALLLLSSLSAATNPFQAGDARARLAHPAPASGLVACRPHIARGPFNATLALGATANVNVSVLARQTYFNGMTGPGEQTVYSRCANASYANPRAVSRLEAECSVLVNASLVSAGAGGTLAVGMRADLLPGQWPADIFASLAGAPTGQMNATGRECTESV
jgi:hypothetical protein